MRGNKMVIGIGIIGLAALAAVGYAMLPKQSTPLTAKEKSLYDFTMKDIDGKDRKLGDFKGKTVLIVNVASRCGLTPQYEGLQKLYDQYKDKGLVILGFPSNQFMGQEPGTEAEIKEFCQRNFGVTFPMFSKIDVKGENAHPLYRWLLATSGDTKDVEWNFAKFLVSEDGTKVQRFGSRMAPSDAKLVAAIEAEIAR